MTIQTWSVSEVCQGVTDLFEQTFPEEIWVRGEVQGYRVSPQGHAYFDLLEPTDQKRKKAKAKIPVTLFAGRRRGVDATLRKVGNLTLDDGLEVRIRGDLRYYSAQSRVQMLMTAIDPRHTLGQIAAEKDRILRVLTEEGLLARNGRRELTPVPLRLAIVTSVDSAAYNDVIAELRSSGVGYQVTVADARVQGKNAEAEIVAALQTVAAMGPDAILLIRGGGSRSDLAAFESELVARAVAASPTPVISGIGHEIDRSIADEAAHTALKTPTAAAGFINDRVKVFLADTEAAYTAIRRLATQQLLRHSTHLSHQADRLQAATSATLRIGSRELRAREQLLIQRAPRLLEQSSLRIEQLALLIAQLHPDRMLQRGFSITRTDAGEVLRDTTNIAKGVVLTTQLAQGSVTSEVTHTQESVHEQ
jgi:exodeoxyribonuclease VII large subunit